MRKLLIILLLFVSTFAYAGIYYVAATGGDNGNAGTQAEPWATIAYGVANVSSGDTVYLLAGTHAIDTRITVPVGVSITGDGETSIISSTVSTTYYTALYLHSATQGTNGNQSISYIKFDGNSETGWGAIQINCRSNVKVHHCTFVDFFSTAVIFNAAASYISTAPATFATGNEFHHNQVDNCSDYPASVDNGQGAVMIGGQDGVKIYDNVINQTTREPVKRNGYCIKFYSNGYNKGFEIYNNTLNRAITTQSYPYYDFSIETWHTLGGAHIYNNTMTGGIDFAGGSYTCLIKGDYEYGAWVHDNTIGPASYMGAETTGLYLERNSEWAIIERNTFKNFYNGIMFSPGSGETTNNHDIRYNVFNQCQYYGIRFINGTSGAYADSINIYNNIFYCASATSTLVGIGLLSVGTTTNLNVINNIIQGYDYAPMFANGASGQTMDKINISNNLMYGNANSNAPLFSSLTPTNYTYANNVINDNPDFTTAGSDFTLAEGSPAIDTGLEIGLTTDYVGNVVPYNTTPDIGAYEYGSEPASEVAPVLEELEIGNLALNIIVMTYDIDLDEESVPLTSDFSLSGTVRYITYVNITDNKVYLHLNLPISSGTVFYLTYSGTAIKSLAGVSAETFANQLVTNNIPRYVTSITISGADGASTITTQGGALQLSASVLPEDATDKTITWSRTNGTGSATISSGGLVTAVTDGTVTARATANDGSGIYDDMVITISNQSDPDPPSPARGFIKYGNKFLKHNGKLLK